MLQPGLTTTETRKSNFTLLVALDASGNAAGDLFWDDGEQLKIERYTLSQNPQLLLVVSFNQRAVLIAQVHLCGLQGRARRTHKFRFGSSKLRHRSSVVLSEHTVSPHSFSRVELMTSLFWRRCWFSEFLSSRGRPPSMAARFLGCPTIPPSTS